MPTSRTQKGVAKTNPSSSVSKDGHEPITLAVDIGGSGIKAALLNSHGKFLNKRIRIPTPKGANPDMVMKELELLSKRFGAFDRLAVGFPGVVCNGVSRVAPNLAHEWKGYDFATALKEKFSKPVRVMNDADMQGYGAITGKGVEFVMTLGTGVGTALFVNGTLVPNVEAGSDRLNAKSLKRIGKKRWNRRLDKYVRNLEGIFNYDRLYIGGGNSKYVNIQGLPGNVTICSNLKALIGGARLWQR